MRLLASKKEHSNAITSYFQTSETDHPQFDASGDTDSQGSGNFNKSGKDMSELHTKDFLI